MGYMAAGGVERLAIVAAALLIVFWGYKLYAGGLRNQREVGGPNGMQDFTRSGTGPGILFMGIGCTVLIITLVTGGSHLQSAGEAYRTAGATPQAAPVATPTVEVVAPSVVTPAATVAEEAMTASTEAATATAPEATAPPPVAETETTEPEPIEPAATAEVETSEPVAVDATGPEDEDALEFADSRELGGRIVSVKSKRATIQWSGEGEE